MRLTGGIRWRGWGQAPRALNQGPRRKGAAGFPKVQLLRGEGLIAATSPGSTRFSPGCLEVDAEPEVVLDLDERVGEPDRAAAGVQPAVELGDVAGSVNKFPCYLALEAESRSGVKHHQRG